MKIEYDGKTYTLTQIAQMQMAIDAMAEARNYIEYACSRSI